MSVSRAADLLPWLVSLPLLAGAAAFLFGPRVARSMTVPVLAVMLLLAAWLGMDEVEIFPNGDLAPFVR